MKRFFIRRQGHYHGTWYTHVTAYVWLLKVSISRYIEKDDRARDGYHITIEWNENEDGFGNPVFQWTIYPYFHRASQPSQRGL